MEQKHKGNKYVDFTSKIFDLPYWIKEVLYIEIKDKLQETLKEFEISIYKEKEALLKHQFEVATSLIKTVLEKEKDINKEGYTARDDAHRSNELPKIISHDWLNDD